MIHNLWIRVHDFWEFRIFQYLYGVKILALAVKMSLPIIDDQIQSIIPSTRPCKAFWRLIKDEVKDSVKIKNTSSVLYLKMKLWIWIANGPKWHPEQRLTRSFHSKFTCKVTWWATKVASNLPPLKLDSPLFEHVFTFRFHLDSLHFRILLKCSQNNFRPFMLT